MLIKLAALGSLGYVGYKLLQQSRIAAGQPAGSRPRIALAGGPLSSKATVQHVADEPPRSEA